MYAYNPRLVKPLRSSLERILVADAQRGVILARDQLLISHLPFIISYVEYKVGTSHPYFEDFVQDGILGDVVGIRQFDLTRLNKYGKPIQYCAYGYWWIRDMVNKSMKSESNWIKHMAGLPSEHIPEETLDFVEANDYVDAPELYAAEMEAYPMDGLPDIIAELRTGGRRQALDTLFEAGYLHDQDLLTFMLNLTNGALSLKQKEIMRLYFEEGWSNDEIGLVLGHTGRWVNNLRNKALDALRDTALQISAEVK